MKIKGFQSILRQNKIDLAIIQNLNNKDVNFLYFTGMQPDYSFLLIPKKGNPKILTSKLEFERVRRFSGIKDVRKFEKPLFEFLGKSVNRFGPNIGINKSSVTLNEFRLMRKHYKGKRYIDISKLLLNQRKQKTPDEIAKIKKACKISDDIFNKLIRNFRFRTEMDIEEFLHKEAQNAGCTLSFNPIVASGKNSSMPHYRARNVKLKKGFLLLDFGIKYKGYMSDMSRTIYLGRPTKHEKEMYQLLYNVQCQAIEHARIGMKVEDLMKFVQVKLGKYNENFVHGLGHGIGVQIHELPSIGLDTDERFTETNIFTVEPGVYFPGKFGIRIEDDILLSKGKNILTKAEKKLVVIR